MKYKLIAIDMDGTLLNSENTISDRNREVLNKVREKGIHVVLSTGRILKSALHYGQSLKLNNPIVACNGAIVSDGNGKDIIYDNPIKNGVVEKLIDLSEKNHIYYHFYGVNTFYCKEYREEITHFYESEGQQVDVVILKDLITMNKATKSNIYKFSIVEDNKEKLINFREKLESIEGINISSSWGDNVEVMNDGVSKGNGLKSLIEKLNIHPSEVMAIGDNENDISMLQMAGLAIGMKNGDQIIKKYSHVITDSNDEDGVANAIEKYALNI